MEFTSAVLVEKLGDRPYNNQTKAKVGKKLRLVEVKEDVAGDRSRYFFIQEYTHSQWRDAQDVGYTDEEEAFVAFSRFIEASPNFGKYK